MSAPESRSDDAPPRPEMSHLAEHILGSIGKRSVPAVDPRTGAPLSRTDGVVGMSLAALVTAYAVLGLSIWYVTTAMRGAGLGALGTWVLLLAGGELVLVPAAAGLALRLRSRPAALRTAWLLAYAQVVAVIFNVTIGYPLFFGPALWVTLGVEIVICCVAVRAYTISEARGG